MIMETRGECEKNIRDFLDQWHSAKDFIEAKTSGSTGRPKIIRLSKEAMRLSARRTNSYFDICRGDLLYNCVSAKYIGGRMMYVRAFESGAGIITEPASNRPLGHEDDPEEIKLLSCVPSQMIHILELLGLGSLPIVRNIIIGGSAIESSLRGEIAASGLNAYETYGMTETCSHIALRKIEDDVSAPYFTLPGIKVDQDSRDCLIIHAEGLDTIITNDVVRMLSDRSFLILGRYDNVIISGGKKVFPEDVERMIGRKTDSTFMITSRSNKKWGEEIVMITTDPELAKGKEEFMAGLKTTLPEECVPKDIIFRQDIPQTENGKYIRFRL